MVAEMLTTLHFEMANATPPDKATQVKLFGRRFEKLGQQQRVKALLERKVIDQATADALKFVKDKRRPYLHIFSHQHGNARKDALEVFKKTLSLVVQVVDPKVRRTPPGAIAFSFNPRFVRFMKRKGIIRRTGGKKKSSGGASGPAAE